MVIRIDASDFAGLARDLESAADKVTADRLKPTIGKAANNIKGAWTEAGDTAHFTLLVSYDFTAVTRDRVELEVGTVAKGASMLDNIAHFGGVKGGGGTVADPQTFLDAEEPALVKYVHEILGGLL